MARWSQSAGRSRATPPFGTRSRPLSTCPLSNECTRVLAYAAEEAERLSHKFIGTEHLFLGLLREQDCFAAQLLNGRGVSLETARGQIASEPAPQLGSPPRSPGVPAGYISQKLLYNPASETVIAELRAPGGANVLPTRLFIRRKDAEAYEQIGNPPEELSYESFVTCDKQPVEMARLTLARKIAAIALTLW